MKKFAAILVISLFAVNCFAGTGINVKDAPYNAVGDGTTDDTAAIQAALDATTAAGGGTVVLTTGTYVTSKPLIVGSKTRVVGAGRGATVLRPVAGGFGTIINGAGVYATIAMVAADSSSVEKLTVDHQTNGTLVNGIVMIPDGDLFSGTPCTRCTIQDCAVLGYNSHEYLIWNLRGVGSKILNNYVNGNVPTNDPTSQQEGIESFGGHDVLIQGNTVCYVGDAAINLGSAGVVPKSDCFAISVLGNQVKNSGYGINLGTGTDSTVGPQNVAHCQLKDNIIDTPWDYGIHITVAPGTTMEALQVSGNSISNTYIGIGYLADTTATQRAIRIDHNIIENSTGNSSPYSWALFVTAAQELTISDNNIKNGSYEGARISSSTDVLVANNVFNTTQRNAMMFDRCTNLSLRGNVFKDFGIGPPSPASALLLTSASNVAISGNSFQSSTTASPIVVSNTCDRVTISESSAAGAATLSNYATNSNTGTATIASGKNTVTVANSLVSSGCRVVVTQESGPPVAFRATPSAGQFTITTATNVSGSSLFRYEIRQ